MAKLMLHFYEVIVKVAGKFPFAPAHIQFLHAYACKSQLGLGLLFLSKILSFINRQ